MDSDPQIKKNETPCLTIQNAERHAESHFSGVLIGMPSVVLLSAAELLLIERRFLKTLNVVSSIYLSSQP